MRLVCFHTGQPLTVASHEQKEAYEKGLLEGKSFIDANMHGYPHRCIVLVEPEKAVTAVLGHWPDLHCVVRIS